MARACCQRGLQHGLPAVEARRLALQQVQDRARTQADRNRLGQFATPARLAGELLHYAHRLLPTGSVRFLDPAIGTGSFYSALLREWPMAEISAATGFEVDAHYGDPCKALWHGTPLQLRLEDFTAARPPPGETGRYNLVICNPPYVRHHHLQRTVKARLQLRSMLTTGVRLSGLAGLYAHFITLAHAWMSAGALAGWLIPSEFMDVNYGRELKRYLLREVTLLRIHRFDPTELQFGDALVSSAIVWLRNQRPVRGHQVQFSSGGSLSRPKACGLVPASRLETAPKWRGFPAALSGGPRSDAATLGDYFRVQRGVATGANGFFIMTGEQAAERRIPAQCLRPILPGPRHLELDEVQADAAGLPQLARQLWILDCRLSEEEIRDRHPDLWRYLDSGRAAVAKGYLCGRREPWFAQEVRAPTFFLCTYIARSRRDGRVQRFIFNRSQAIAANSYLMLYPREALDRFIRRDAERARLVWHVLNRIGADVITAGGRVYGGGLHKVEPKELASIPVPQMAALLRG
ncbi:MAG: Eco57I restriction-modification methylase domain-containing protein [Steroidobacteraceae bacterium]